jgi:RND family efflux transporter MFP subunit
VKRWVLALLVLVVVALVGGAGYLGFYTTQAESEELPPPPETVSVVRSDVEQTVSAPGLLVTTQQIDLALEVGGRLAQVLVQPGDGVKKGDVLARLDAGPLERAVAQADVNVRLAQLDLADAREEASDVELASARAAVRDTQVALQVAQGAYDSLLNSPTDSEVRARKIEFDWYVGHYQRKKAEYEEGHLSQSDHDHAMNAMISAEGRLNEAIEDARIEELEAKNRVDRARSTLYEASEELKLLESGPLTNTLMRAELAVDQALLTLEQARADLEAVVLRAPFDGVVVAVHGVPGDQISAGASLISLLDPAAVEAKVTVIEEDLPLVEIGQPVEVFFDARPDVAVQGRVARIVPQREPGSDRPLYPVYVALDQLPERLAPGMTVDCSIVIARRSDVLCLPRALVRARSDGTAEVEVWANGQVEERTIQVGLRGDVYVEILDGLREGEQVLAQ